MKLLTIIGARPQFIKAGALSREIKKNPLFEEIIIHTGQHFDANMSDIFFEEMDIPKPNYNLNINGLSHGAMTGQMLEGIENIILNQSRTTKTDTFKIIFSSRVVKNKNLIFLVTMQVS